MDALSIGVVRVTPSNPGYPSRLRHLSDPPDHLHVRGSLEALEGPCVTIVGSRRATAYGRRVAEELAAAAVRTGWTVVSGLALGIDGAAHRGALREGGVTVAVLGGGPDRAHPRAHQPLMDQLLGRGAVLSEHPPGTTPRKHHFPRRNRILAALAHRVVVVEAATRSGALITAGVAGELGRDVWAVPGSVFSPASLGTHALLDDGAIPVVSLDRWEASLRGPEATVGNGRIPGTGQLALGPAQEGPQRWIWEALEREALPLEALSAASGLSPGALLPALTELELGGWISRMPGPLFSRRAA